MILFETFQGGASRTAPGVVNLQHARVHSLTAGGVFTVENPGGFAGGPIGYLFADGGNAQVFSAFGQPLGTIPNGSCGKIFALNGRRFAKPLSFQTMRFSNYGGRTEERETDFKLVENKYTLRQVGDSFRAFRLPKPVEVTHGTIIEAEFLGLGSPAVLHGFGVANDLTGNAGTGAVANIWGRSQLPTFGTSEDFESYTSDNRTQLLTIPIGSFWQGIANFMVFATAGSTGQRYEVSGSLSAPGNSVTISTILSDGLESRYTLIVNNTETGISSYNVLVNGSLLQTSQISEGQNGIGFTTTLPIGSNNTVTIQRTSADVAGSVNALNFRSTQAGVPGGQHFSNVRIYDNSLRMISLPSGQSRDSIGTIANDPVPADVESETLCDIPRFRLQPCSYFGGSNTPRESLTIRITRGEDYFLDSNDRLFEQPLGTYELTWNAGNQRYETDNLNGNGLRFIGLNDRATLWATDFFRGSQAESVAVLASGIPTHGAVFVTEAEGPQGQDRYNVEIIDWGQPSENFDAESEFLYVQSGLDGEEGNELFINGLCFTIFPNNQPIGNGATFDGSLPPSFPPGTGSPGGGNPGDVEDPINPINPGEEGPTPIPMCEHDDCEFVDGGSGMFITSDFGGCSGTLSMSGTGCNSWVGAAACESENSFDNPGGYRVSHRSTGGLQIWTVDELDSNLRFRGNFEVDPQQANANIEVTTDCNGFSYKEYSTFGGTRNLVISYEFTLN